MMKSENCLKKAAKGHRQNSYSSHVSPKPPPGAYQFGYTFQMSAHTFIFNQSNASYTTTCCPNNESNYHMETGHTTSEMYRLCVPF